MTKLEEDALYNIEQLRRALLETADKYPLLPGLVYRSPYDFVAQHGRAYLPSPFQGRVGAQLMCFGNALIVAATLGFRYVEGFALSPPGQVIHHAWNRNPDGRVYDSTWANTGLGYLGVEFSVERADDATWNGDASVLNDEHRGYPLFRQPWTGEDYSLTWPPSDRLTMLQSGKTDIPASIEQHLKERKPVDSCEEEAF